jgi:hypothetical protein
MLPIVLQFSFVYTRIVFGMYTLRNMLALVWLRRSGGLRRHP